MNYKTSTRKGRSKRSKSGATGTMMLKGKMMSNGMVMCSPVAMKPKKKRKKVKSWLDRLFS